jgi:hypothetical protein
MEEVLKIRLTDHREEDCIAWYYERSEIFTVRSAYKLALTLDKAEWFQEGSCTQTDSNHLLYKEIRNMKVPPKVCIFAWRLSHEGLATQAKRKRRTLTREATCQICEREEESGHHAVVPCTKAAGLRHEMRKVWSLPNEEQFHYSGPD